MNSVRLAAFVNFHMRCNNYVLSQSYVACARLFTRTHNSKQLWRYGGNILRESDVSGDLNFYALICCYVIYPLQLTKCNKYGNCYCCFDLLVDESYFIILHGE